MSFSSSYKYFLGNGEKDNIPKTLTQFLIFNARYFYFDYRSRLQRGAVSPCVLG